VGKNAEKLTRTDHNMNKRNSLKATALALVAGVFTQPKTSHAASGELWFPGDPPQHKLVYQVNRADPEYINHILGSLRAMVVQYGDNVALAVVAFGPGIHLLATRPERPVSLEARQRIVGFANDYGVELVACGNTLTGLGWGADRVVSQARIEEVGASALMTYQEKGYAYIAW
jgi:intracellular sulfur oxidation DsrE/DsrF family protein